MGELRAFRHVKILFLIIFSTCSPAPDHEKTVFPNTLNKKTAATDAGSRVARTSMYYLRGFISYEASATVQPQ